MKDRLIKYKQRYDALEKREQYAVLIGGIAVGLFLLYELIWSPYLTAVENLRQRISDEQATLQWMQSANQTLQQMQSTGLNKSLLTPVALLGVMQKEINNAGLTGQLTGLRQSATDGVQMSFQKVEFDKLIILLTKVIREQNVSISQMSVTADTTPGLVAADITLKLPEVKNGS